MNAETLLALAARAEAGGDATLSDDCWRGAGWVERKCGRYWFRPDRSVCWGTRPPLDTSIDAQEAVGATIWHVRRSFGDNGFYYIAEALPGDGSELIGHAGSVAPTECLARLAAKLRALAGMESADAP